MSNPYLDLVRLGYLMGDLRLISAVDIDTPKVSIYSPSMGAPTTGTRFIYKGEGVSDLSANRAFGALSAQIDFGIFQDVRPKPMVRIANSGYHSDSDKFVVCWVKEPVVLPWDINDLALMARGCDADGAQLTKDLDGLGVIDAYTISGGVRSSVYAAGSLTPQALLSADPVVAIYPWGVTPTSNVLHYATVQVAAITAAPPGAYILEVNILSGTLDVANPHDGLFFDDDSLVLGGCVIASVVKPGAAGADATVTLLDEWVHAGTISAVPGDVCTVIGPTHVVPGMLATLSAGDPANDGTYLITDVTSTGDLVLSTIDNTPPMTLEEVSSPLPTILTTGAAVALGKVDITSHLIWFPVFELSQVPDALPGAKEPKRVIYHASLPEADQLLEDVPMLPGMVDGITEGVVKVLLGTPKSQHWTTQPTDSIVQIDARLDAVTLDGVYRHAAYSAAYESPLTDNPPTGRHAFVDDGAFDIEDVPIVLGGGVRGHGHESLMKLAVTNTSLRTLDRVFKSSLGTEQIVQYVFSAAHNIDMTGPFVIDLASAGYPNMRNSTDHGMPSFVYFSYSGGMLWGYCYVESFSGGNIIVDFLDSVPPGLAGPVNAITATVITYPTGLLGFDVADKIGRPNATFNHNSVPPGSAHNVALAYSTEYVDHLAWFDQQLGMDGNQIGYRFSMNDSYMGVRFFDSGALVEADAMWHHEIGFAPLKPLLHLFDTGEQRDGAPADKAERTTLMLGSHRYRDADHTSAAYFGPILGSRHGRQWSWTSSLDTPKTLPTDVAQDVLLFGTGVGQPFHDEQTYRAGLFDDTKIGWTFVPVGGDTTRLEISEWGWAASPWVSQMFALGPGRQHAPDTSGFGAWLHIFECDDSTKIGMYKVLLVETTPAVGPAPPIYHFELHKPDLSGGSAVDFAGVAFAYGFFTRMPVFTHSMDENFSRITASSRVLPSRERFAIATNIGGAVNNLVEDTHHGVENNWSTILTGIGAWGAPERHEYMIYNDTAKAIADFDIAAGPANDWEITHDAFLTKSHSAVIWEDIRILQKDFETPGGEVVFLADIGRLGAVSYTNMFSDAPIGGRDAAGRPASLHHYSLTSPDHTAIEGTVNLDPVNDLAAAIVTADVEGNIQAGDLFFYNYPDAGEGEVPVDLLGIYDGTSRPYSALFDQVVTRWYKYNDQWYYNWEGVHVSLGMLGSRVLGASHDLKTGDITSLAEDAEIWQAHLNPWWGPGTAKENTVGLLSTARSLPVNVAYPETVINPVAVVPEYATGTTWPTTAGDTDTSLEPVSVLFTVNTGGGAVAGYGAFGYRVKNIPEHGMLHRYEFSVTFTGSTLITAPTLGVVAKATRNTGPWARYIPGYTNQIVNPYDNPRILSKPGVWAFTMGGAGGGAAPGATAILNVPEVIGGTPSSYHYAGQNTMDATMLALGEGYSFSKALTANTREIVTSVRAPRSAFGKTDIDRSLPVWMPRYEVQNVFDWQQNIDGAAQVITYSEARFVRFKTTANGADVAFNVHGASDIVDTTEYFGIRVSPFLRWDDPIGGLPQTVGVSRTGAGAGDTERPFPISVADVLVLWKAGEPYRFFPILGPGFMECLPDGGYAAGDWPGLVIYDPDDEAKDYIGGYGAVPAFGTEGLNVWVGVRGDAAFNGRTDGYVQAGAIEYIPISQDHHFFSEHIDWDNEPTSEYTR